MNDETPTTPFFKAISDRLSHPVFGIFSLAFTVCNWKPIFFLFSSDKEAGPRIAEAVAYTDATTLVAWPVFATIAYVFTAPVLKRVAIIWDLKIDRSTDKLVSDYDIEKRIQTVARLKEQARELSLKLNELTEKIEADKGQIALLTQEREYLEKQHAFLKTFESAVESEVKDDEDVPFRDTPETISKKLRARFTQLELLKQQLVAEGVILSPPSVTPKR